MDNTLILLVFVIVVALGFGYVNGWTDAANAIATVIGTRVLSPRAAIIMAAILNLAGALTGTAVAVTIGKGIIQMDPIPTMTIIVGAGACIIWSTIAWYWGLPTSESHGLVAGLLGAGLATAGSDVIAWGVLWKVLASVGIAPLLGFAGGFLLMLTILWVFQGRRPATVGGIFGRLQILSAAFMAYAHGKNDGQMPMAIIMMGLAGYYGWAGWTGADIPLWVMSVSALSIALGTATGGWRIIRTVGTKITTLRPVHGFAAETAGAAVVEVASHLGIPVSTTHCIGSSIMGVGATKRLSAVRWGIARNIVLAWVLTFPICAGIGWLLASLLSLG